MLANISIQYCFSIQFHRLFRQTARPLVHAQNKKFALGINQILQQIQKCLVARVTFQLTRAVVDVCDKTIGGILFHTNCSKGVNLALFSQNHMIPQES